ncbi:MAG: hypothetical protein IJX77_05695 [Ruminococcus sp.]|nr:hypothetical protein [Ruminococcus sp.]
MTALKLLMKPFVFSEIKVFWSSNFSKMLADSKGSAFGRRPQTAKFPHRRRIYKG